MKRRTLTQSLQRANLSEAAIAFVNGSPPVAELNGSLPTENSSVNSGEIEEFSAPVADQPSQGSVSMSFRLPAELSARLLRVSLDRKLKRHEPMAKVMEPRTLSHARFAEANLA